MAYCFIERHVNVAGTMWCECGSLVAGTPVDGYNVISYLGHGTSGDVYLAEQRTLNNRKVVIKIAHRSWSQADIDNFRREAALLASLSHPYILPIYAYGVIYERRSPLFTYSPYLVLPYAEQGSLEEAFLRSGKRPWPLLRVVSMAQEIADALDYAHARGVLHRDVKPANVLQMGSHVLLADFSVASLIDADVSHVYAPLAGSPAYMASEVWRHNPGRYSDQYALAVTCFRLLAGEYPWAKMNEGNIQEWLHLHCHMPPRPLQAYRPNLPSAVDLVLQKALAKDPHERYETVQAFAADLLDASEDKTLVLNKPAQEVQTGRSLRASEPEPLVEALERRSRSTERSEGEGETQGPLMHAYQASPGKDRQSVVSVGDILPSNVSTPGLEASWASPKPSTSTNYRPLEGSPILASVEPITEDIQENVEPSAEPAERVSMPAQPAAIDRPHAASEILSGEQGTQHNNRWLWYAVVLNGLIGVLLAGEAYWQSKGVMPAVSLLLALWPSALIGPLLARWFRRIRLTTFSWGVFWGVFFGMTNVLACGLVCYLWVVLGQTFLQWGNQWQRAGDGLRIVITQVAVLAPTALMPLLLSLWLAVLGGALLGIAIYRSERALPGSVL